MKGIKAIIKPFVLEKVLTALDAMEDLPGVTISEVSGWGRLPERRGGHDVAQAGHGVSKKVALEIVVKDEQAERVVRLLETTAHTGNPGDGKIFIYDVQRVIRIRTGESDSDAI